MTASNQPGGVQPLDPSYLAINDLRGFFPEVGTTERVRVAVTSIDNVPIWAFVTVTNNETQHVTTITSQR
jgi:hypothetical protein